MAPGEPLQRAPSPHRTVGAVMRGLGAVRLALFGISPDEAKFAARGFAPADPTTQQSLETIGRSFIAGYTLTLETGRGEAAMRSLIDHPAALRGFVVEGAAMALALLDLVSPWPRRRFAAFVEGPARHYDYLAYVGAGWALARVSWRLRHRLGPLDPLLRWLMLDGYGFHEGYFHPRRTFELLRRPRLLEGYERRAFDQGVGRSLWFAMGASIERVHEAVQAFPEDRRPDIWSGVGLAAVYAGGADPAALPDIVQAAGDWHAHLGQGAAFAAAAHRKPGPIPDFSDAACAILAGVDGQRAAEITLAAQPRVDRDASGSHYEAWRDAIRTAIVRPSRNPGAQSVDLIGTASC